MNTSATLAHLKNRLSAVTHARKTLEATCSPDDPALGSALWAEERLTDAIKGLEWRRDRIAHRTYLASLYSEVNQ